MDRITVICRPAKESDTPDMLEVTRTIWDGGDYVPQVWAEWLADPHGRLIVAEYEGRVIGLTKLSRHFPGAWWLHGLRVHPDFEGRGVASQLHHAALAAWKEIGDGALRLATASFRHSVQHLSEQDGFIKVGEFTIFVAPSLPSREDPGDVPFTAIAKEEFAEVEDRIRCSPVFNLQDGLLELGWEFAPLHEKFIQEAIERGMAWWWRGREGALLAYDDEDDDDKRLRLPFIEALACDLDRLSVLLADYRRLARQLGCANAAWIAPLKPQALAALAENGFERAWEHAIFVYALD